MVHIPLVYIHLRLELKENFHSMRHLQKRGYYQEKIHWKITKERKESILINDRFVLANFAWLLADKYNFIDYPRLILQS